MNKYYKLLLAVLFVLIAGGFIFVPKSEALTAGPNSPGTAVDNNAIGTSVWSNPTYITVNDSNYATNTQGNQERTHYLYASQFGFSIPVGATITEVVISVRAKNGGATANMYLNMYDGANQIGTQGSNSSLTSTETGYTRTATVDYGALPTVAQANSAGFGVRIFIDNWTTPQTNYVNYASITITYTVPTAPTIITPTTASITASGATLGGNVTSDGGASVTGRGVCVGTSINPTTGCTSTTGTTGVFTVAATGLTASTLYHYRAYATNSVGTSYTTDDTFTTLTNLPSVTTTAVGGLNQQYPLLNGTANPGGFGAATGYFRWGTTNIACDDVAGTRLPTTSGVSIPNGSSPVAFSVSLPVTMVTGTTYYYCAYASNANGVGKAPSNVSFGNTTFTSGCTPSTTGDLTLSTSCYPPDAIGGVDMGDGSLTSTVNSAQLIIPAGYTFNIGNQVANQIFGFSVLYKQTGSTIVRFAGAQLRRGSVWVPDADTDGYPNTANPTYEISLSRPAGYVRRSATTMSSNLAVADCAPNFSSLSVACAPTVTTTAATSLAATSATLNGTATAATKTGTGGFRYGSGTFSTCAALGSLSSTTALTTSSTSNPATSLAISVGSLSPNTTYYFCATATNNWNGSTVINDADANKQTLLTKPGTPTSVTAVQAASTSINVSWTAPAGGATSYNLIWCSGSSCTPGTTITGVTSAYNHPSLSCNTIYGYQVVAVNASGSSAPSSTVYATAACAPTVATSAATSVVSRQAILNSTVTPNSATTSITYRYGTSNVACASLGSTWAGPSGLTGSSPLSGATTQATLTGLTPSTLYYFCATANNAQGTTNGTVASFTTLAEAPSVTTSAASSITSVQAVLNSTINPNGASTNVTYAYGTSNVACTSLPSTLAGPVGLTGTSNLSGASTLATLTGRNPNTTYYFCAYATNAIGTTYSSVLSFTTSAVVPSITAQSASSIAITSATLNSTVNPNNATTSITYRYSTSNVVCSSLASTLAGPTGLIGLNAISPNATSLTGLTGNTTYYYCATANNTAGTIYAVNGANANSNFLTYPGAPTSVTGGSQTQTSISVSWTAPTGGAASYDLWRCTGTGCSTFAQITAAVTSPRSDTGLTCNTIYRYRIRANNATGSTDSASSADVATSSCITAPSITAQSVSSVAITTATLNSTVNPNNGTTSITYRYYPSNLAGCSHASMYTLAGPTGLTGASAISPNATSLTGLNGNSIYYYCSSANNSAGTTYGVNGGNATSNFLTYPGAVTSVTGSSPTQTAITVSWTTATGGAVSYDLWRCTGTGCSTFALITAGFTSGSSNSGLTCGTIYRYRIRANNATGSTDSASSADVATSACATAPSVTTSAATSITGTQAVLNSSVNPNNGTTSITYRYGTSNIACASLGTTLAGPTGLTGASPLSPNATTLTGLSAQFNPWYFCASANNTAGTTYGSVLSFSVLPSVTTNAATSIAYTTTTIGSNVIWGNTVGDLTYRYGTSNVACASLPTTVQTRSGASGSISGDTANLTSLSSGTTYYFCATSTNSSGTTYGSVLNFTTLSTTPTIVTVDNVGTTGYAPSIAMGSDGFARISYTNLTVPYSLKFIQCTNAACSTKNITTIDSASGGVNSSIAMGSDEFARIAYGNKFVQCTNASCSTKIVTTLNLVGGDGISIAMGSDGFARISSYYDNGTNNTLVVVQCTNAACSTNNPITVDNTMYSGAVGFETSIAMGSDGFARISYYYYDGGSNGFKFVQCTNASCLTKNITTISSTGGNSNSIAMGSDGFARISYWDGSNGFKFVQCTNASCSTKNLALVDSGNSGNGNSIAMGSDGLARLSYYDYPTNSVKFAQCTNAACTTKYFTIVAAPAQVPSMALGSDGFGRISYRESVNSYLNFVQCWNASCQ